MNESQYDLITRLFFEGKWDETVKLVDELSDNAIYLRIVPIKFFIQLCQGKDLHTLDKLSDNYIKSKVANDTIAAYSSLYYKLYTHIQLNKFDEFDRDKSELDNLTKIDHLPLEEQYMVRDLISSITSLFGIKETYLGNYNKGIHYAKKALNMINHIEAPHAEAFALYSMSFCFRHQENVNEGIKYAKMGELIVKEHNLSTIYCILCLNFIVLYRVQGDTVNMMKYAELAFDLASKIGFTIVIQFVTGEFGNQYAAVGQYKQALNQYEQGLILAEKRNDNWLLSQRFYDIGQIYQSMGELKSALNSFKQALIKAQELGNESFISRAFYAIGTVYFDQGRYEESSTELEKSLSVSANLTTGSLSKSNILLSLVLLSIELRDIDKAKTHVSEIEKLKTGSESKRIETNLQLANAYILKVSPRLLDKIKAQEIFNSIVKNKENNHNTIIFAMFNLCDLLIYEYKLTTEKSTLDKIMKLSQEIHQIGNENHAYPSIIKGLLLKAKLSLVEGNLEDANNSLAEAYEISAQHDLIFYLNRIEEEKNEISMKLEEWKTLLDRNAPLQERIEHASLDTYIKGMINLKSAHGEE